MSEITRSPGKAAIPQGTADYTRVSNGLFVFGYKIKTTTEQCRKHFYVWHLMGNKIFPFSSTIILKVNGYLCHR